MSLSTTPFVGNVGPYIDGYSPKLLNLKGPLSTVLADPKRSEQSVVSAFFIIALPMQHLLKLEMIYYNLIKL